MPENPDSCRADVWLWACRFYRHRSLATEACRANHVHSGQNPIKPGTKIRPGQTLRIRNHQGTRLIKITGISLQRLPFSQASELYEILEDHPNPKQLFGPQGSLSLPSRKPDKRDRRKLNQLFHPDDPS